MAVFRDPNIVNSFVSSRLEMSRPFVMGACSLQEAAAQLTSQFGGDHVPDINPDSSTSASPPHHREVTAIRFFNPKPGVHCPCGSWYSGWDDGFNIFF